MNQSGRTNRVFFLILAALLLSSLACSITGAVPQKATRAPTAPASVKCVIPDLAGIDQQTALKSLTSLGLIPVKKVEFSENTPENAVIATDPPGGTTLEDCRGEITLIISTGPRAAATKTPAPTRVRSTSTPMAPVKTATIPILDILDQPMYDTVYTERFDPPVNGFKKEWEVIKTAGSTSKTDKGWLELNGDVTALVGDKNWQDTIITLSGVDSSKYSMELYFRMQDLKNNLMMSCQDVSPADLERPTLYCEWFRTRNGSREKISGTFPEEACGGICDIVVVAKGSDFRFLFNGQEKFKFSSDSNPTGKAGFRVKTTSSRFRLYTFDVSEPQHPASPGVLLFRDDFKTGSWFTGSQEDDLAAYQQNLAGGKYQWHIKAKESVSLKQCNTAVTLPGVFSLSAKIKAVSGPKDAAYALVFNCKDYSNLYFFKVSEGGTYGLFKLQNGQWTTIIGNTAIDLKPGEENRLEVTGGEGQYLLSLNGKPLGQFSDTSFVYGGIGLGVELYHPGDEAVVEFDDIHIDEPQGSTP